MRTRSILRSTQQLRRALALPVAAVVVLPLPLATLATLAQAQTLPAGAVVSAGKASVSTPNASTLQVRQDSQRAVMRWSSFNIGQGSTVNFAQPNAAAATLNVVTGAGASELAGKLNANGSVFLINQQGIAVTKSGTVDVRGGFVASTLGMSEDDFMNGRLVFQGKGGDVRNSGSIVAGAGGYVALLGSSVSNDGLIVAPLGKVALASGQAVTLDLAGDGYLQVLLPADAAGADGQPLVSNSGSIEADGGAVVLKAATVQQALREAVHMPGQIRARSVSGRDGAVVLDGGAGGAVRVSGQVDATAAEGAASGGRIDVSGHSVALSGATLDASASSSAGSSVNARGGLVRVGGAFQGGRAPEPGSADAERFVTRFDGSTSISNAPISAATTSIDSASRIDVSAKGAGGEGGAAVVWSEQSTVMAGAIDGRGTRTAGAVEVSSAATIASVALNRIALGKGGKLLLDPQNIEIGDGLTSNGAGNAGSVNYGDNSGGVTELRTSDVIDLLSTGTSVSLKASQDISWQAFSAVVTPALGVTGGDLALSAGRSITLRGSFQNAGGHWTMVANDTAANGVIDAERGAGLAQLNLGDARFINSNGRLDLTLADGAGNSQRDAIGIALPFFQGDGLSATVAAGASSGIPGIRPVITLNEMDVANDITLSGHLRQSNFSTTMSGQRVNWLTESTDSITGEGRIKFVENGVSTRMGVLRGMDAVRLSLGDGPAGSGYSRVYGDAVLSVAALGNKLLHVTAGTTPDALADILAAGSVSVGDPGASANAGNHQTTLTATSAIAFNNNLNSAYFLNLASASVATSITRRTLTPTLASAVSMVYGTPAPLVSLSNLVSGDVVMPQATLDGAAGTVMATNGAGYGFADRLGAGQHAYTLTGLAGAAANNYQLDTSGGASSGFEITRKPLTYAMQGVSQTYGTQAAAPGVQLTGVLSGDDASGIPLLSQGGLTVAQTARMNVGSYTASVGALGGASAANYQLAASGHSDAMFNVLPLVLTYSIAASNSIYGSAATLPNAILSGVLAGDTVTPSPVLALGSDGLGMTPGTRTAAGTYGLMLPGLAGSSAANYMMAPSGNSIGSLVIAPKVLNYSIDSLTQTYGVAALPQPALSGVLSGDSVSVPSIITSVTGQAQAGASGALPVGDYTLGAGTLVGASAANYVLGSGSSGSSGRLVVQPRQLSFSDPRQTLAWVYGDTVAVTPFALAGVVNGDAISLPAVALGDDGWTRAISNRLQIGNHTLVPGELTGAGIGNYVLATANNGSGVGRLTVTPRPLTWSTPDATVVYGNSLDYSLVTLNGVLIGDSVAPNLYTQNGGTIAPYSPFAPAPRVHAGSYQWGVWAVSGRDAGNYVIANNGSQPGVLTVTPRPLTYDMVNTDTAYGSTPAPVVRFHDLLPGDLAPLVAGFTGNSAAMARPQVGTHTGEVLGTSNPDYTVQRQAYSFEVVPKAITWNSTAPSLQYGDMVPASGWASLDGVLPGDDIRVSVNYDTSRLPKTASGNIKAGTYQLSTELPFAQGASSRNYRLVGGTGTMTVLPREVSYYAELSANGSAVSDIVTYGSVREFRSKTSVGWMAPEDNVRFVEGRIDVPLSSSGWLPVGDYMAPRGSFAGADASNYVLKDEGSTRLTTRVVPRAVSSGWRLLNGLGQQITSLTYGSTIGAGLVFDPFSRINGDDVRRDYGLDVGGSLYNGALPTDIGVGTYRVVGRLSGRDAGNYYYPLVQNGVLGTLTVNQRPISVQYGTTRAVYGDVPVLNVTLSGALSGDDIGIMPWVRDSTGNPGLLDIKLKAGDHAITASQTLTGASARNYVLVPEGASWSNSSDGSVTTIPRSSDGTLSILPRYLPSAYAGPTSLIYGDMPNAISYNAAGVLAGDDVQWRSMVAVNSWVINTAQGTITPAAGFRLPVGNYSYFMQLLGTDAENYTTNPSVATLNVTPRTVTASAAGATTTYGTLGTLAPGSLTGVVANERISAVPAYTDSSGRAIAYNDRTSAGSYAVNVTALQADAGFNARNYQLDTAASSAATLVVQPKTLDLALVASQTRNYGTSPALGSRGGVLSGDDVAFTMAGDTGGLLSATTAGALFLDRKVDVGNYNYNVQVSGAASGNYRLANNSGSFSVTPKPLLWTVSAANGQYGNYQSCNCTNPVSGVVLGNAVFQGVLPGDELRGSVRLLDLAGTPVTIDSRSPVGSYFQVVDGLSGASSKNYVLASTGNQPGIFNLTPLGITWTTTSGILMPGYGVAGSPGTATLHGPNGGGLLNGDVVNPVVTMTQWYEIPVTDMTNLRAGRYYFLVKGLSGPDAGNYRPLQPTAGFNASSTGYIGLNDVGTLDVFADTTLGLSFTSPQALPLPPPVRPPPAAVLTPVQSADVMGNEVKASAPVTGVSSSNSVIPRITTSAINLDPSQMLERGVTIPIISRGDNEDPLTFERENPGTGVSAGVSRDATSVRAEVGATAETGTSTTVGDVTVSTQAEVLSSALAKFGVTGVTLQASASGHVDVMLSYGPGYVTFGAQGSATASAKIGRSGVTIEADASAGTFVGGGAAGSIANVGDTHGNVTVGAYATVNADYKYGMIDGVLTMKTGSHVGVGVQAGVTGGISGGMGSVEGGATIMSPGTIGASFDFRAGYSNGTINFGFDIGAAIGIGGIQLKLDIGIDLGAVGAVFTGLFRRTDDIFTQASKERQEVMRLSSGKDKKQLLDYLATHKMWSRFGNEAPDFKMAEFEALRDNYINVINTSQHVLASQRVYQEQMLGLLQSDPQAAVELARSQNQQMINQQREFVWSASRLGLKTAVDQGVLTFRNQ